MTKVFRVGSSIKVTDRANKESFFTVEMQRGSIALMKNGRTAMTRSLITDGDKQYFTVNGTRYERGAI